MPGRWGVYVDPNVELTGREALSQHISMVQAGRPKARVRQRGFPGYGLYRAREGYVSLAALEKHFWERVLGEFGIEGEERPDLERIFQTRTAGQWEEWAAERDIPLAAVKYVEHDKPAFTPE